MDTFIPAIVGGAIGAILTAIMNLIVTHMNNDNQRTISENNAAWQAQREQDDAWRRETYEHAVWVRERKEKLYSNYLVQAETIKITNITNPSTVETQERIVDAFTVLTEPDLFVIASKDVSRHVKNMMDVATVYFTTLNKANKGENDWSKWKETAEVREAYKKYRQTVNEVSNAMRTDLGIEPIYNTPAKKES